MSSHVGWSTKCWLYCVFVDNLAFHRFLRFVCEEPVEVDGFAFPSRTTVKSGEIVYLICEAAKQSKTPHRIRIMENVSYINLLVFSVKFISFTTFVSYKNTKTLIV